MSESLESSSLTLRARGWRRLVVGGVGGGGGAAVVVVVVRGFFAVEEGVDGVGPDLRLKRAGVAAVGVRSPEAMAEAIDLAWGVGYL